MSLSIPTGKRETLFNDLKKANTAFQQVYPGDRSERQPVHTLYGGANLFKHNAAKSLGARALEIFETYAPDHEVFGKVFEMDTTSGFSRKVYDKVIAKLKIEAIEDFRIDFEDGYGNRSNEEEDETARTAALEVAKGMQEKTLPPFIGIRIKPFTEEMKERGLRTLDIFVSTLVKETGGKLPDNFIVMLPKVTIPEQPATLAEFFDILEGELKMQKGMLKMEMMVETTQSIMDINGTNPLYRFIKAANGRCIAMHFGTYDYTASCNITAKYQEMDHPVCDFAHHMTKVALAHTGIWLSDGATNTMPIGPHRGHNLTEEQLKENMETVHHAWKKGYDHIRHSLWNGFYQGWDLNPAQFPMRYAAVFAFFLESYDDAVERLKTFVEKAARATLIGDVFDDAATGQGLLNYFLRALNSDLNTRTAGPPLGDGGSGAGSVWEFIQDKLNASIRVILLYVLESEGSSPGRQGFKMAVAADGAFNGTIGGGIMEHKLVEKARQMLIDNVMKIELMRQYHDKQQASNQSGMICSGSQLNAFIPLSIEDRSIIGSIAEGKQKLIQISPEGFALMDAAMQDENFDLQFRSEDDWLYKEKLNLQPVIHIVGGGHVSLALSELMSFLGFYVKVYDDRPALNTMEQNQFAHEKTIIDDYGKLGDHVQGSPGEYVVIITFGYRTDKVALKQLLDKKFAYVGLIGSDKKIDTLFKELEEEGIAPEKLRSVFAPIGINIFSRTTPEIAVSIAAEIIREKNKDLPTGRHPL